MSANTQQVRTFTNPSDPMNNVNPFFLFMGLPMDALLLVARYVNYEGFENIALTCQYGNQQFQLLLANERFNRNVRPARQFLMNDRRKELTTLSLNRQLGLPESNSWSTDAIMSANGKWLFILNKSRDGQNRLYCFQQQSTSPLRYRQVAQHRFSGDPVPGGYFDFTIVGQDPSDENPGVYLTGSPVDFKDHPEKLKTLQITRQIYSWHLHDKVSNALKTVGQRLPFSAIAVAHRQNGLRVYGVSYDANQIQTLTMSHDGQVSRNTEELALALEPECYHQLKLSPSCESLALLSSRKPFQNQLHTLKVLTPHLKTIRSVPFTLYNTQYNFSITDDGGSCIYRGAIIPLNGSRMKAFGIPDYVIMRDHLLNGIIAHNGTGSICIGFDEGFSQKVVCRQLFSQQKKLSGSDESTLRYLRDAYNIHLNDIRNLHQLLQVLSLYLTSNMMGNIHSLTKRLNLRNPRSLCTILYEMTPALSGEQEIHENFLFCLSNAITLMEIVELVENPNLHKLPRTGLVELALSERGQSLRNVVWGRPEAIDTLKAWFENPFQIETKEIGRINSVSFFWESYWTPQDMLLRCLYTKRNGKSEKNSQLREIERTHHCTHPLLLFARETSEGVNFIETCCHSRLPKLDNKRHQVLTAGVVKIIGGGDKMKNYFLLNTILKKIIALTFNRKQKDHLRATQTAMLQAVESNPSLREDMEQLLTTHFYGNDSVEECLQGSPYYQEIMLHLRGERPDVEEALNASHGSGSGV